MKKMILLLCLVSAFFCGEAAAVSDGPNTSAEAAVVIHADSGAVLHQKNADKQMLIASTTKVMTALIAAEELNPDREVTVDPAWTRIEGSSMYLRPGEVYTVRELLYGLMLASGNDAAMALACTVSDTPEAFAKRMNEKACELGLKNTHFANPHGLDAEDHYSTAGDMAVLMAEALKNPLFAEITAARSFSAHGVTYVNHNKLLWRCEGVNGGKTGYTKAAGRCLITACERAGLSLVCVTLSAPDDWRDHTALYDWAYREYEAFSVSQENPVAEIPVISGKKSTVGAAPQKTISLCIPRGSTVKTECCLPRFVFAKVDQGSAAGELRITVNGEPYGSWPLRWLEAVPGERDIWLERLSGIGRSVLGIYYY